MYYDEKGNKIVFRPPDPDWVMAAIAVLIGGFCVFMLLIGGR